MDSTSQPTRTERLQQRLANSRYWSVSLAIHAIAVATLGTIVLVKNAPVDEFIPIGEIPTGTTDPIDPTSTPIEQPKVDVPETKVSQPPLPPKPVCALPPSNTQGPSLVPPIVTYGKPDRLTNVGTTTNLPTTLPTAPSFVPSSMAGRFVKDGSNRIMGRPGRPDPTPATENAVLRGLNWLREKQNDDGSWGEKNKGAMTGLALLAFLGHGETGESKDYGFTVNRAIQWVLDNGTKYEGRLSMTEDGWGPGNGGVYEHGILTYALGEYYTLTQDQRVTETLRRAVGYIVAGQGPDGGWMYQYDKTQGDTSVTGWQVQALKAAHLAKLNIPGVDAALDRAMAHFDRVQGPKGGYGYRTPGDRYSLSGVGVLCELFVTGKRDSDLRRGVDFILEQTKTEPVEYQHAKADLYAWYYHTQAMLMYGGNAWIQWERQFNPMCVKSQAPDGSWPVMKSAGHGNLQNDPALTGAVYRTALNVLMLETYYRYLPLNQANHGSAPVQLATR